MKPLAKRFWEKVRKTRKCWLWTAGTLKDGYGAFKMPTGTKHGKQCRAHRIAWELTYGEIPKDKQVLHQCDQPLCVRPAHLFLGTCAGNMADRNRKGRQWHPRGMLHGHSRFTLRVIRQIRRMARTHLQREVAEHFRTTQGVISRIVNYKAWAHVV